MLIDKYYVPLLKAKIAEVEAYRQLSSASKDRTFPVFLLRPWPNANELALAITRILDAVGGRMFGLGLDDERFKFPSKKLTAQKEFDSLFDQNLGFRTYFDFIFQIPNAIPVLRPTSDANTLLRQLGNAENLDRGLIVHQQRGSLIPITDSIVKLPPLPNDTVFIVDGAWSRDVLQLQSWTIPIIEKITAKIPQAEIVVMSSSFPDSFSHIIGDSEEPAHEIHLYNSVRNRFQSADLTYGDWGSTRLSQDGGGGTIPSRIDVPRPMSWQIFRADPKNDAGFETIASEIVSHPCFKSVPECWGKLQISSTDGNGTGITGTKMNTSARINMHMSIQAGADLTLDGDEQPYED